MIKLKYKAIIEIEDEFKDDMEGLLPFTVLKDTVIKRMTPALQQMIKDEFTITKAGRVEVTEQEAEVWRVEE